MKPLPVQNPVVIKATDSALPSLPPAMATPAADYSKANRRSATCPVQRIYPWLLFTSTAVAALFCLMYITKPVILASQGNLPGYREITVSPKTPAAMSSASMMPSQDRLPGEKSANGTLPAVGVPLRSSSSPAPSFEQTNIRIQHILTAEAPGGHLARIDLDVPVLYHSRNLRWSATEVTQARALLARLANYQEKSQLLRAEGSELLDSWNHLVERSIPASDLRADSPTLPTNQQDASDAPRPAGLNTTELIKIQPAGK